MATRLESQPFDITTANFKLWAGFIRNLLVTTCGWTATADTGQTNPTTVGSAPTNNTWIYEIYQATDTLSSTKPVIVKIEYGQSNSVPSVGITVGTGSSGTGSITGGGVRMVSNLIQTTGTIGTPGSTTYECVGSGDASGFRFVLWRNHPTTNVPVFLALERSRDSSGAYTGDYFTLYFMSTNFQGSGFSGVPVSQWRQQTVLSSGAGGNLELAIITCMSSLVSAGLGTSVAAVPAFPLPGYLGNPSMDVLCGKGGDFAEAASNSVSMYGSARTYYSSKVGALGSIGVLGYNPNPSSSITLVTTSNNALLFRYE